jgi:hypothetical protein
MCLPLTTAEAETVWGRVQRVGEEQPDCIACHICPLERRQDGDLWLSVRTRQGLISDSQSVWGFTKPISIEALLGLALSRPITPAKVPLSLEGDDLAKTANIVSVGLGSIRTA